MTTLSKLLANRKQAINVTSSEPALKVTQNGSGDALRVEVRLQAGNVRSMAYGKAFYG